jgi:hypothetical protein
MKSSSNKCVVTVTVVSFMSDLEIYPRQIPKHFPGNAANVTEMSMKTLVTFSHILGTFMEALSVNVSGNVANVLEASRIQHLNLWFYYKDGS